MNSDRHKYYLRDLGDLLKKSALEAKLANKDSFTAGRSMAYYEIVSLMQSQAKSFGIPLSEISLDGIDPDKDLL